MAGNRTLTAIILDQTLFLITILILQILALANKIPKAGNIPSTTHLSTIRHLTENINYRHRFYRRSRKTIFRHSNLME